MRGRRVLALVFILLSRALVGETKIHSLSTTTVPARPYVGDIVESTIAFDPGAALLEEGSLPIPPASKDGKLEIVSARILRKSGSWVYSVRFIAWAPGSLRVPSLRFKGLEFPEIPVTIASALDDFGRSPPQYKDALELKGTRLLVWGVAGGVLIVALLAWSVIFGIVPWARRLRRAWRAGRAGRDFGHTLDYLEKSADTFKTEEEWALLCKALRVYLSARTDLPYQAFTAMEAAGASPGSLPQGTAAEAAAILSEGESVRFAKRTSEFSVPRAIERARGILKEVEEAAHDSLR